MPPSRAFYIILYYIISCDEQAAFGLSELNIAARLSGHPPPLLYYIILQYRGG